MTASARVHIWIRDLHEEGIHPHPGPRFVSKNLNGIQGGNKCYKCLKAIRTESSRSQITAAFLQEHNLDPKQARIHRQLARGLKLVLIISYAPRNPGDRVCWGGTAIVIPWESLERRARETLDDAIGRITRTKNSREKGRITTANVTVEDKPRKLISAYAPAGAAARDQIPLPWMAAPTPDRGGEISPCGATRSTACAGVR